MTEIEEPVPLKERPAMVERQWFGRSQSSGLTISMVLVSCLILIICHELLEKSSGGDWHSS